MLPGIYTSKGEGIVTTWTPDLVRRSRQEIERPQLALYDGPFASHIRLMHLYRNVLEYIGIEADSLPVEHIVAICEACWRPLEEQEMPLP